MKTTKKLVLAALAASCLVTGAVGLSACGGEGGHVHTYSTTWTAGETQHYYAATCGHSNEKLAAADHVWGLPQVTTPATETTKGSQTVACVVCGKTKTESIDYAGHTYSDNWTVSETHHWHAVACEHTDAPLDKKAHEWNDVQITEEGGVKYATKECSRCHYVSKTEVTGVTAFDFKIQKTGTGSSSGKPTGNAVYIENNEVHILPNTVMNFDFINFEPADDSAFAEFKTNYKKIKVYEVTEGDVKTELTSSSEPALIQLDWRTASGKDNVFFQLKVTDGQSHKICVETEFASKEFTVIPDAPSTINVKYSLDNGTTWNDYTSTIRSGVTVGQTVLFTADLAGYTVTPPASGGTLSENSTVTPPEGFSGVYALTPTEAATVSITLGDGKFASASVRVKATAAA